MQLILFLVEKGVSLDVAECLPPSDLEGWATIFGKREKELFNALACAVAGGKVS